MRIHIACLALILIGGCESREEARQKDVHRNLKQIEQDLKNYHESHKGTGTHFSPVTASKPESITFPGKVIAVKDGDSIVLLRDKEHVEIRLDGVPNLLSHSVGRRRSRHPNCASAKQ